METIKFSRRSFLLGAGALTLQSMLPPLPETEPFPNRIAKNEYYKRWGEMDYKILPENTPVAFDEGIIRNALFDKSIDVPIATDLPITLAQPLDELFSTYPWFSELTDEIAFFSSGRVPDFINGRDRMSACYDLHIQEDNTLKRVLYISLPQEILDGSLDPNIPIGHRTQFIGYEGPRTQTYAETFVHTMAHEFGHAYAGKVAIDYMKQKGFTSQEIYDSFYKTNDPLYAVNHPALYDMAKALNLVQIPWREGENMGGPKRRTRGKITYYYNNGDSKIVNVEYKENNVKWSYTFLHAGYLRPEIANLDSMSGDDFARFSGPRSLFGPPHEMYADLFADYMLFGEEGVEEDIQNYFNNVSKLGLTYYKDWHEPSVSQSPNQYTLAKTIPSTNINEPYII